MQQSMCSLALLVVLSGSCGSVWLAERQPSRRFRFMMSAQLAELPAGAKAATIWLPAPTADQEQGLGSLGLEHSVGDVATGYDDRGNRMLSITGRPEPGKPLMLRYRIVVERFRVARTIEDRETGSLPKESRWLEAARLAPTELVRRNALFLTASQPGTLGRGRILFDEVVDSMRYARPQGGSDGEGDLAWILAHKSGDATDFHSLFVAYCQSLGIPASLEAGYRLPITPVGEVVIVDEVHCWARFQVPGMGWIPVDAAAAKQNPDRRDSYFGGLDESRIRLSRGRDLTPTRPRSRLGPQNLFVRPHAEADGVDISDALEHLIQIEELPVEPVPPQEGAR